MRDDGAGPLRHCERGRSHCADRNCWCANTTKFRALYARARLERGWDALEVRMFPADLWWFAPALALAVLALAVLASGWGGWAAECDMLQCNMGPQGRG